jgi:hypothetical protein
VVQYQNWLPIRHNGQILRDIGFGWKLWKKLTAETTVEGFIAGVKANPTTIANKRAPSIETMRRWENDGYAKATDNCKVEVDGTCPHGKVSWLKVRGIV